MEALEYLVIQLVQPYFYYALAFSIAAYIAVNLVLRCTSFCSHRSRSFLYLLPLMVPVFVYLLYPPELTILALGRPEMAAPFAGLAVMAPPGAGGPMFAPQMFRPTLDALTSVTGILCLAGIVLAAALLTLWCLAPAAIMRRAGVVRLQEDEFPHIWKMVREQAEALGIAAPRLGLVEDLRPNAMVFGRGSKALLAFSLGLLNEFDNDEIGAVIAHEMMHIKHHDHVFRGAAMALGAISFFNPLSYFAVASALRERELYADRGASHGRAERTLTRVLSKLAMADRGRWLESGGGLRLLFWNDLASRRSLATHPSLKQRIRFLEMPEGRGRTGRAFLALSLVWILLLAGIAAVSVMSLRDTVVLSERSYLTIDPEGVHSYDSVFLVEERMRMNHQPPMHAGPVPTEARF